MKKWWMLALAALIIGVMAGGCGDDSTESSEEASTQEQTQEQTEEQTEEQTVYQIGEKVEVGELAYEVTNVSVTSELTSDNQFIDPVSTEGQFIIIDVTAYNNDKEARTVDSNMFKVKDDQGREFEPTTDFDVTMIIDEDFFLEDINPGLSLSGKLVFELPADATSYTLEASSGFGWSGGEYVQIQLQ